MRSIYAVACSAMVMLSAFTACSNDDSYELTPEQIAYIEKNIEYIREKKQEKNENGELVYQQLVKYNDTILYRIIDRKAEPNWYKLKVVSGAVTRNGLRCGDSPVSALATEASPQGRQWCRGCPDSTGDKIKQEGRLRKFRWRPSL